MPNQENRVLNRRGARQLTPAEVRIVCGASGIGTETVCSFNPYTNAMDGDVNEC